MLGTLLHKATASSQVLQRKVRCYITWSRCFNGSPAENYTCVYLDETQSAHWKQHQISLFTAVLWHSGKLYSKVVASDNLTHSKETLVAYVNRLLEADPSDQIETLLTVPKLLHYSVTPCARGEPQDQVSADLFWQLHTERILLMELVVLSNVTCGQLWRSL